MIGRGVSIAGLATAFVALLAVTSSGEQVRVWGTCSAAVSQNPRYQNQWEYTIEMGWDATGWEPERLEQVALFLDLASCPCVNEPTYFAFPHTNGIGTGKEGLTTHYYYSGYSVIGDLPRFAPPGPALVFEYIDTSSVLNAWGTARFAFMSTASPGGHRANADGIGIAVGPYEAVGEITGVFPSCDCPTSPVEPNTTWGVIKAMFK